jgi:FkbH-like protein
VQWYEEAAMQIEVQLKDDVAAFTDLAQSIRATSSPDYRKFDRHLRQLEHPANLNVALMGNLTVELIIPYLRVEAARIGKIAKFHASPFGQYMQDLHNDALTAFNPDAILLILSPQAMRSDAFERFHHMTRADRLALRDGILAEIGSWITSATARTHATLMIANFPRPAPAMGLADLTMDYGEQEFFLDLNLALLHAVKNNPRVQLLDIAACAAQVGANHAFDQRVYYLCKLGWTEPMMRAVGKTFAHIAVGAFGLTRKCVVLDLDNTLWGGVVGEDGPYGIRVGQGDMASEAFHAFQRRVLALKQRGILLAVCSKNNPEDVDELFRLRDDMPLKWADFSASAIGWSSKAAGVEQIAQSLNIGLDAIVFIDDNPAEVVAMRAYCPDVASILLPPDPADFVAALDELPWFEKSRLTADDDAKSEQYARAQERAALQSVMSPQDYLADLEMKTSIRPATNADVVRLHQLFNKTNQFNLVTGRPTLGEVEAMIDDPATQLVLANLRDRFGDLGTVAAYVLRRAGDEMVIDHWVMSCRAMGRGLEHMVMNDAKQRFLATKGSARLIAHYIPSPKNIPVSAFCEEQGFVASIVPAGKAYHLDRSRVAFVPCAWIQKEEME